MSNTCPLFWRLSVENQALLMQYQWDEFGTKIDIPPLPKQIEPKIVVDEDTKEIDKLMRQKPSRIRGG